MPGRVRLSRLRASISKYRTTRLDSRTSLWAASFAIPTRPGAGESPNSILLIFAFCSPMSSSITVLPIDSLLPEILASLRRATNLIVEAAPGAGKTTRVPPALLEFGGDVLVLEPRRIAARLAARRVAHERGEEIGGTVGYQVRFEEAVSSRTRLRFLTEGVLTRRMISDP